MELTNDGAATACQLCATRPAGGLRYVHSSPLLQDTRHHATHLTSHRATGMGDEKHKTNRHIYACNAPCHPPLLPLPGRLTVRDVALKYLQLYLVLPRTRQVSTRRAFTRGSLDTLARS